MATTPADESDVPPPLELHGGVVNSGATLAVVISGSANRTGLLTAQVKQAAVDSPVDIFVAKTPEGSWLTLSAQDDRDLKRGRVPDNFRVALIPENTPHPFDSLDSYNFGGAPPIGRQFHLLVQIPGPLGVNPTWLPEEEPVYALDRCQLKFVGCDDAIQQLLDIHFSHFQGRRCGRRRFEWQIPLVDNASGFGKTDFGFQYIQQCRKRLNSTMDAARQPFIDELAIRLSDYPD